MKTLQATLINVAIVVVALVLYDQLRGGDWHAGSSRATSARPGVAESVALEERLRRIEAQLAGIPERDVEQPAPKPSAVEPSPDIEPKASPSFAADPTPAAPPTGEPTEAELVRFRRLQAAVEREDSVRKSWDRIHRQLDKAGVRLTPAEREKIHYAWADFEPRVMLIWDEIKIEARATVEAGGQIDSRALRDQGNAKIQSEFAASLSGIVNHPADAEAVAAALTARDGK